MTVKAAFLTSALGFALLAQPAAAEGLRPKLAPGVMTAPAYAPATERLVVANPTPIFSELSETSKPTGQLARVGEPVNVLARVPDWDWVLVGKDGVGVGYVPRSLLKPAS